MAKLTGAKKKAFLERMAKGRRKAAREAGPRAKKANPKRKTAKKKNAKRKPAKKNPKLTGAKKKAFLERMAKGRRKAARKSNGSSPKSGKKRNPPRRRRRNNEMDDAAAMYETFHQRAPGHIVETETTVKYRGAFAELGRLKELRVDLDSSNKDFPFTGFGDCIVVATPDGSNIYFQGGDQAIDYEALAIESDKDTIELGPCTYICYHTVKGFHDFAPTNYWHRFGEEDGIMPRLGYDRLNKTLYLIGGNYTVKREGIVN